MVVAERHQLAAEVLSQESRIRRGGRNIASTNCRAVSTPVGAAFRFGRVGFMARRYTDAYRASQRRGSAFVPRPPQSPS